jgi:Cu(I)/Ag(I) efflux system periplasmic protein CusF
MSHVWICRRFFGLAILVLSSALVSSAEVRAQGMQQKGMDRMPGMGDAKQGTTASATGTVTAVNTADRKIFNHGPTMPSA